MGTIVLISFVLAVIALRKFAKYTPRETKW